MENENIMGLEDEIGEIINQYEANNNEFVSSIDIVHMGDDDESEHPKAYVEVVTKHSIVHDRASEKRIKNKLKERENGNTLPTSED